MANIDCNLLQNETNKEKQMPSPLLKYFWSVSPTTFSHLMECRTLPVSPVLISAGKNLTDIRTIYEMSRECRAHTKRLIDLMSLESSLQVVEKSRGIDIANFPDTLIRLVCWIGLMYHT